MEDVDLASLQIACWDVARAALWSERGTLEIAVAELAGEFVRLASTQVESLIQSGRDPNIATRAVKYLFDTHVIPSGDMAKWWFSEMLTCLLELAVPSMIQTPASAAFLRDVQEGIGGWTDSAGH